MALWCLPQVRYNRDTARVDSYCRRILILIAQINANGVHHKPLRFIWHPRVNEGCQVQAGFTVQQELI